MACGDGARDLLSLRLSFISELPSEVARIDTRDAGRVTEGACRIGREKLFIPRAIRPLLMARRASFLIRRAVRDKPIASGSYTTIPPSLRGLRGGEGTVGTGAGFGVEVGKREYVGVGTVRGVDGGWDGFSLFRGVDLEALVTSTTVDVSGAAATARTGLGGWLMISTAGGAGVALVLGATVDMVDPRRDLGSERTVTRRARLGIRPIVTGLAYDTVPGDMGVPGESELLEVSDARGLSGGVESSDAAVDTSWDDNCVVEGCVE